MFRSKGRPTFLECGGVVVAPHQLHDPCMHTLRTSNPASDVGLPLITIVAPSLSTSRRLMSSEHSDQGAASKRDGGWGRGRGRGGGKRHKQQQRQAVAPPPSAAVDLPLPEGGIHIDGSMLEGGACWPD